MKSQRTAGRLSLGIATLVCLLPGVLRAQIQVTGDNQDKTVTGTLTGDATVEAGQSIVLSNGFFTNGKNFRAFINSTSGFCYPLAINPDANQNYIRTYTPREAFNSTDNLNGQDVCRVNQEVQYFDGLGRPLQTVIGRGSGDATKDLVQVFEYDAFGREAKKYQPYAYQPASWGQYRPNAVAEQGIFYNAPPNNSIQQTSTPFSQTVFEPSPLNRVEQQGFAGGPWQPAGTPNANDPGHTMKMEYGTNTATGDRAVRLYEANPTTTAADEIRRTLSSSKNYDENELYLTITKDENWTSGKSGTMEEYKDKEGRVVLKRTWLNETTPLSTYYVYDDLGNLSFVLPPKSEADGGTPDQTTQDALCYQYRYDGRQRLIEKRIPGRGGWDEMVYNKIDQLILSRDMNQRNTGWEFYKYDGLGRQIMTGVYLDNNSRASIQNVMNNYGTQWETRQDNGGTGYTNDAYPNTSINAYHTINYYDDYDVPGLPYDQRSAYSTMTKSLLTATKTAVLNSPTQMLWTVNYYDNEGRITRQYAQHYRGGTADAKNYDEISNTYNFTDQITQSTRKHYTTQNANAPQLTIVNDYNYDHMGRKIDTKEQINGQTPVFLARNIYNDLGQLRNKMLHSENNGSNFMQNIAYQYNERGWMTNATAGLFAMNLGYNNGSSPQYNGNIASQNWGVAGNLNNYYNYSYDKINRLISGITGLDRNEQITYDKNGNILTLNRTGQATGNLSYDTYDGNKLKRLNGYVAGNFEYDDNGNLRSHTYDTNPANNINTIVYNYLNLPQTITGGINITYTYDATGKKLRKQSSVSGGVTTDYVSGIQYKTNGEIDFIQTEEGRAVNNNSTYKYEYALKDHLGNSRVMFDKDNNGNARKIQATDYYPFGLEHQGTANTYLFGDKNKYTYNGKELQDELTQYDYGARFYDPVIGRWNVVDPSSEKYYQVSPYNYTLNNPIIFIDPNGREVIAVDEESKKRILNNIKDLLGENNGFSFRKNGSLVYKKKDVGKDTKYSQDQKDIIDGLTETANDKKRDIFVQISDDENGSMKFDVDKGNGEKVRVEEKGLMEKDNDGNFQAGQFREMSIIPGNSFGIMRVNSKQAKISQNDAGNGKKTNPSESAVFIHELLDHGLYFIRTGAGEPPYPNSKKDEVIYQNKALKIKGSLERTGEDHGIQN